MHCVTKVKNTQLHVIILPVGQYHCPVTYKVFNDHSYIVAIKTTGNVFSNEVTMILISSSITTTLQPLLLHIRQLYTYLHNCTLYVLSYKLCGLFSVSNYVQTTFSHVLIGILT